jgi:hypothetical protein
MTKITVKAAPLTNVLLAQVYKLGFTFVGQGVFKTILKHPDQPNVVFICFTESNWDTASEKICDAVLLYSSGLGKNDPFIPKFLGKKEGIGKGKKRVIMYKVEELKPITSTPKFLSSLLRLKNEMAKPLVRDGFNHAANSGINMNLPKIDLEKEMESEIPGSFTSLFKFTEFMSKNIPYTSFDISLDNLMQRSNGQLVYNDIWSHD